MAASGAGALHVGAAAGGCGCGPATTQWMARGDEADGQHAFQRQERDPGAGCYKSAELRKHKMQGDYNN